MPLTRHPAARLLARPRALAVSDHHARARRRIAEQPVLPAGGDSAPDRLRRMCTAAAHELSACGVAVSVLAEGGMRGVLVASDPISERVEELQLLLGEGPCVDALAARRPVLVSVFDAAAKTRWPLYCPSVYDDGVRAVFAFPLQVGAAQLGVLGVYRANAGPLSTDEVGQALTFSQIITDTLIGDQDSGPCDELSHGLQDAVEQHGVLFQAQGMVMVQLGVPLAEALTRMRAYAFAESRSLIEVSQDIVARTLSFESDR